MIVLWIVIGFTVFFILTIACDPERPSNRINFKKDKIDHKFPQWNDLINYLNSGKEQFKGMVISIEDSKKLYIQTDIDSSKPISELFKEIAPKSQINPHYSKVVPSYNADFIEYDGRPYTGEIFIAHGYNFIKRGIEHGQIIGVHRDEFPKISNVVMDNEFVIWLVVGKTSEGGYGLERPEEKRKKIAQDKDIYGVVTGRFNLKYDFKTDRYQKI
jgi:hypothetical protein